MRFRVIVFDWDGTLIESLPLKIDNAAALFAEHLGAHPEEVCAAYRTYSGVGRRQLFDEIARDCIHRLLSDEEFALLSAAFTERNQRIIRERGDLRPGTREALHALREAGLRLCVSTSAAQDEMEPLVGHFGVAPYFDLLLGSRPGFAKGPDHVEYVSSRLGVPRSAMAGVGDDERDVELFVAAGITPVGITGTRSRDVLLARGAEFVVDDLREVVAFVRHDAGHR